MIKSDGAGDTVLDMVISKYLSDLSNVPNEVREWTSRTCGERVLRRRKANAQVLKQEYARLLEEPNFAEVWTSLWSSGL